MNARNAGILALAFCAGLLASQPVQAGCGCDHPPPVRGPVYPRFAWPNSSVSIYSPAIRPGKKNCIRSGPIYFTTLVGSSTDPNTVDAVIPPFAWVGPRVTEIWGKACDKLAWGTPPDDTIAGQYLTVLPETVPVVEKTGRFYYVDIEAAVDASGTLLIPFDLSNVREPMQFFVTFHGLPLRFTAADVSYYNADEYNLKLFENLVASPYDYEWGAFFGTGVESAADPATHSDMLSYWRHEFYTYAAAHAPGGTHEVGPDGLHPDGSLHVDHYHLIAAIQGKVADPLDPLNPETAQALQPGRIKLTVEVHQLLSTAPVALADLNAEQQAALADNAYVVAVDAAGTVTVSEDPSFDCSTIASSTPNAIVLSDFFNTFKKTNFK
jgi:hypothetical protein